MAKKQSILVTGAGSGFGARIVRTQLQAGDTVFATMREPDGRNAPAAAELAEAAEATPAAELAEAAEATPGTLHVLELDVTNDTSVESAVDQALRLAGRLDVVVNNAGIGSGGFAETFTVPQFEQLFNVNVFGVQRVTRAALPAMREAGAGLLVFVSSIMGRLVIPFSAPYTATKFAVEGLAESYAIELAGTGVDVAIVEPGGFPTGIGERIVAGADVDRVAGYGDRAQLADEMWGAIMQEMEGPDAPDPQLVADAVRDLVAAPAGGRPLRTVVDPLMGGDLPSELNRAGAKLQAELLQGLKLG
jgi:NAD(P)-dependent dehydrogenase (short-subunit alcohol dehydrogenase family)